MKEVYIADDNRINNFYLNYLLTSKGYMVTSARNGLVLKEMVEQKCPDLIILDIQMPEMDGYAFASWLNTQPDMQKRKIPLLAVTAYSSEDVLKQLILSGIEHILTKPWEEQELLAHIEQLLGP